MSSKPRVSILTSLFKSEDYLQNYLAEIQKQSIFEDCEFILVFNRASQVEKKLALASKENFPQQIRLIFVDPLESLGASWNRAWKEAQSDLIAVWNVDDRRAQQSLEQQWQAMLAHPEWQLCYGDYLRVNEYGQEAGQLRQPPPFSSGHFRRAFPQGGAFWVMRRALFHQIGFFDEQFQIGPDLDYSLRIAHAGLQMGRVDAILGYFTDAEAGLSTRDGGHPSDLERTAIQLRYGIFDKVRPEFSGKAGSYRLDQVLSFGEWIPLEKLLPELASQLARRRPLWLLGKARNTLRGTMKKLGILNWIYAIQRRMWGREL